MIRIHTMTGPRRSYKTEWIIQSALNCAREGTNRKIYVFTPNLTQANIILDRLLNILGFEEPTLLSRTEGKVLYLNGSVIYVRPANVEDPTSIFRGSGRIDLVAFDNIQRNNKVMRYLTAESPIKPREIIATTLDTEYTDYWIT